VGVRVTQSDVRFRHAGEIADRFPGPGSIFLNQEADIDVDD
jgi:hypothetical protein